MRYLWFRRFIVASLLVVGLPSTSFAQGVVDSCASYTWRLLMGRHRTFTKLPFEAPVHKQCGPSCWAHASTTFLELLAKGQHQSDVRLSVDYLLMSRLKTSLTSFNFDPGERHFDALRRIMEFGVLEQDQWRSEFPLETRWRKLMNKLQDAKQTYLLEVQSANESGNGIKNISILLLKNRFEDKLIQIIEGEMGKEFVTYMNDVETRRLAQSTAEPYMPYLKNIQHYTRLVQQQIDVLNPKALSTPTLNEKNEANLPMMLQIIRQSIDSGRPVLASLYWTNAGKFTSGSVLSSRIDVPFFERGGAHAVTVVGYHGNSILIQNSYGPERGDQGYFEITKTYLQKNLNSITVLGP